jgi:hypothetical protein
MYIEKIYKPAHEDDHDENGRTALIGQRQPNRLMRSYYIYIIGRRCQVVYHKECWRWGCLMHETIH